MQVRRKVITITHYTHFSMATLAANYLVNLKEYSLSCTISINNTQWQIRGAKGLP